MNGEICCILGACCPELRRRILKLARSMVKAGVCPDMVAATHCAKFVLENFDLAPVGTLTPLISKVAEIVREHDKHGNEVDDDADEA